MGDKERKDSLKVLEGKEIKVRTSFSLLSFLLRPYYAYKQKQREAEIRKNLFND